MLMLMIVLLNNLKQGRVAVPPTMQPLGARVVLEGFAQFTAQSKIITKQFNTMNRAAERLADGGSKLGTLSLSLDRIRYSVGALKNLDRMLGHVDTQLRRVNMSSTATSSGMRNFSASI